MKLYSKNDCPLCEDAEEILIKASVEFAFVDIELDSFLIKKYHTRVPVLVNHKGDELGWPFHSENLNQFLKL